MPIKNETFDEIQAIVLSSSTLQEAIANKYFIGDFADFSDQVLSEVYGTPQLSWFTDEAEMQVEIKRAKDVIGETLQANGFEDDYD